MGLDSNAAFANKWLKIYNFTAFLALLSKSTTVKTFTAFAAEWPPCSESQGDLPVARKQQSKQNLKIFPVRVNVD